MCTNYYARMRFTLNLLPQLTAASNAGQLSRMATVLAAGSEDDVRLDDLDLKHDFTLHACLAHCVMLTDFMIEELAKRNPGISFMHSYPGTVKTGIAKELTGPVRLAVKVLYAVMSPWIIQIQDSGERHTFQLTSSIYAARNGSVGLEAPEGLDIITGSDGVQGSGSYLLDWDGRATGDSKILRKYRDLGMGQVTWDHTMHVFNRAMSRKRSFEEGSDQRESTGPITDPTGWRPG